MKLSTLLNSHRTPWVVVFGAAIAFNNWLLGLILNWHLFASRGSVSELSAITQPHHQIFRILDITAGILILVLSWLLAKRMPRAPGWKLLVGSGLILGVANVVDAVLPLNCSETLDTNCNIPVHIGLHHFTLPSHGYSSIIIGICYLTLPLGGWLYAKKLKLRTFWKASVVATAVAVISGGSAIVAYIADGTFSERAWGPSQEIQMFILATWLVFWCLGITRELSPNKQL